MMWNKSLLKLGLTFLVLSLIYIPFIYGRTLVYLEVAGPDSAFPVLGLINLGTPALILLSISIILLITSRFYRKDISLMFKVIFLMLGVVIFALPFFLWLYDVLPNLRLRRTEM